MLKNGIPDRPVAEEQAWLRKWRTLHAGVSPRYLRCFSAYLSDNREQIVPGEISANVVEPLLNPVRYRSFYEDKNVYGMLFDAQDQPRTYLRMMNGICYDANYRPCAFPSPDNLCRLTDCADRVLVKPAVDSDSGRGIVLYRLDQQTGLYRDTHGKPLRADNFSDTGGGNAIMQEFLSQHPFTAQFNPTSVNSFRMIVYRSPFSGRIEVLHTIFKAGGAGTYVDNIHAGGGLIGVGPDATLGRYACDQYGRRSTRINGIELERQTFTVPQYEALQQFARRIAERLLHSHLTALDVMLDQSGSPRLIECNIKSFSYWIPQFCTGPAYGAATDEIIDYCRERLGKLHHTIEI